MKNRFIDFLFIAFFFCMEVFIFKNYYTSDVYTNLRSEFWIYHLLSSLVFIGFLYFILKRDIGYYDVLIIFFPVIGIFIMMLGEIFDLKANIENPIEEAYSIEEYKKKKEEDDFINFYADINTLSAYDFLLLEDSKIKKKFLFEFTSPDIAFKVEILQKALLDKDVEVIHYAAIELNKIDVKLQQNIKEAEEEGNKYEIYKAYKKYISSGLCVENILTFYQEKTLNILLKIIENDKSMEIELLDIYYQMKRKIDYENILKKLLKEKFTKDLLERYLKFLYEENRFKEMIEVYKNNDSQDIELPISFAYINSYGEEK